MVKLLQPQDQKVNLSTMVILRALNIDIDSLVQNI